MFRKTRKRTNQTMKNKNTEMCLWPKRQAEHNRLAPTAVYFLELSLCVLLVLANMRTKRADTTDLGLEVRGEGRESVHLIDLNRTTFKPPARGL